MRTTAIMPNAISMGTRAMSSARPRAFRRGTSVDMATSFCTSKANKVRMVANAREAAKVTVVTLVTLVTLVVTVVTVELVMVEIMMVSSQSYAAMIAQNSAVVKRCF